MPNLIDHLVFRAKLDPNSVALQGVGRQLTFEQLLDIVKKIGSKLRQTGIRPGQLVITSIPDKFMDWIVTLALFHEATITCSNHGYAPIDPALECDWVITNRKVDHFPADRTIQIDRKWMDEARGLSSGIDQMDYPSGESPVRLYLTSGTTGQRKAVAFGLDRLVARVKQGAALGGLPKRIGLLKLSAQVDFAACATCLLNGSPIYCTRTNKETVDLIRQFSLETLHGSPGQIAGLIEHLVAQGESLDCLKSVRCAGGAASPTLLKTIETYLCKNIINSYGSTEAGGICTFKPSSTTDPSICGYPQPEVTVQVVDESDQPLPLGQEGLVRVKTTHMVNEYFKNPQETARSFRNGWFYPGDRGRLAQDDLLVLAGRSSEMINRGGVKIDPATVDRFLADYPGIADAAAFAVKDNMGLNDMAVAVVVAKDFDLKGLAQALKQNFEKARRPSIIFRTKKIPRNEMGKVMRAEMSKSFAERAENLRKR